MENYDNVADVVVFLHSHHKGYPQAWHTDSEDYDNVNSLRQLRFETVQAKGYVNLRCVAIPGCPDEIQPFRNPWEHHRTTEHIYEAAWNEMFGPAKVPEVIGVPCCSQFAVSMNQIRKRPKSDYERYLTWLMNTPLSDDLSGRVFEYTWHMIFGQDAVL